MAKRTAFNVTARRITNGCDYSAILFLKSDADAMDSMARKIRFIDGTPREFLRLVSCSPATESEIAAYRARLEIASNDETESHPIPRGNRAALKWSRDFRASGARGEYMVTERRADQFPVYFRTHGESAYREIGILTDVAAAQRAARDHNAGK